ncbi:MAG: NAD-dependent epimerase/dehydratase family protein [Anaerolineae bacterium]
MNVLLTGAFGNIGTSTLDELLRQGHHVRCFDLPTRANRTAAQGLAGRAEVLWGDLRRYDDVLAAVEDQEVIIHLAFIIPKLSATGFESEDHPDWARDINVGGTRHLLRAAAASRVPSAARPPRFLFASSYHIYGRTHDQPPPRTVDDPVQPIEHYAHHKVECEAMVRASGLEWAILRLAASLPIAMKMDPGMFDVPPDNRMEYVHTRDVGLALTNAVTCREVAGKVLLIGGGPRCQYLYSEITGKVLAGMGLGPLPEEAFTTVPFPTDWLDTAESQRLLAYQRHTLDDYVQDMRAELGHRRHLVRAFRPLVRYLLLKQSPYYRAGRNGWIYGLIQGWKALKRGPTPVELG